MKQVDDIKANLSVRCIIAARKLTQFIKINKSSSEKKKDIFQYIFRTLVKCKMTRRKFNSYTTKIFKLNFHSCKYGRLNLS